MSQDHRQLNSSLICRVILPLIQSNPSVSIPVFQGAVWASYHFKPSYRKVWMAKQKAIAQIYGDWEESYNKVPKLLQKLQSCFFGTICTYGSDRSDTRRQQQHFANYLVYSANKIREV
ncbi:hypothetical protein Ahy_B07g086378 [Arachis hypogaea]|uniref:Uncharacterized protein n=1 Tax=Arachis hypogaea TaxID=3818 RepID=A0A444Y9Q1_ARAHY|nr:hypothetical protein Ahy_B07g086378 [Arachis hypogaea]